MSYVTKYLGDPREMSIRPESGYTLEEDNRFEPMWHFGAAVYEVCGMPFEEYSKPMSVISVNGGGDGGGSSSSSTPTYTLKFYLDGTQKASYRLEEGAPIPSVSAEKEGYDFSGWKDASGNTYSTMPASNLTLYGTNTIKKFNVSFRVDNEALADYDQVVEWGKSVQRIPSSSKTGYDFSGWDPEIPSKIKDDYTFSATFTKKRYTVSFNISGAVQTQEFEFGENIVYPAADTKEGYTICGWTPYHETMPDNQNLVFNAVLSANEYTVKYLIDFGDVDLDYQVVETFNVRYGQNIPACELPVQSGYSFSNWSADTEIVNNKVPARNVNFFTLKTVNNYTLVYKIDGEQDGAAETYSYGAKVTPRDDYEKEGYTVTRWSYSPELDVISQELGGGYSMPYSDVVATCETSVNSYNVVVKYGNTVLYSGVLQYGASLANVVPEGYTYSGDVTTVPAHDVELEVSINSYNVTLLIDGVDTVVLPMEYNADIMSAVEDYVNDHYPMGGYHIESNIPDGAKVPAHDVQYEVNTVPNKHTVTVSGGSDVVLNYGDNILNAIENSVVVDEFHYIDGWLVNGQPLSANATMPDEDITVVPVIKVKESEVTPVVSGETATGSTTYDYGTPISEVIEDIIASATPETKADLEDPGYAVEWTVNGSAYTDDMVVKEDEVTVEVTITPKPFALSFMIGGNAAASAGVIESGETLYKEAIVYPQTPVDIEVGGKRYEFKWDDGSVSEGTPMPSSAVVVYGEYVELQISNTVYYGTLNYNKLSGFTDASPEFAELSSVEGMPVTKEFPMLITLDPAYPPLADLFYEEEDIEEEDFYAAIASGIARNPIILLPETISKTDYIWKRMFETVDLRSVKTMDISGTTYELWYEHTHTSDPYQGFIATDQTDLDVTIKFENI